MLCCSACVLGSGWEDVEVALDRLVSQEREASTGDSQKLSIMVASILCMYFRDCMGHYNSLEGWG